METGQTAKAVRVFVLGRPGTGKSTAARFLMQVVRTYGWSIRHIDDYGILYSMYKADRIGRFRKAAVNLEGFDVLDFNVFDEALAAMKQQVDVALTRALDRMKLVIIEFARGTYKTPLEQFGRDFLQEGHFLLLDSDIDTCMARIEHRAHYPVYSSDHFMSREAMEAQFSSDAIPATRAMLKTEYGIDAKRIRVIYNLSSEEVFLSEVYQFIERVIRQEADAKSASDVSC